MAEEIVKQSELKPANFIFKDNLTFGQKKLLKLLNDKIKSQEVIYSEDIQRLYMEVNCPDGTYKGMDYRTGCHVTKEAKFGSWHIKSYSMQWFRNNLGSCILKGKLLAIPVIQID